MARRQVGRVLVGGVGRQIAHRAEDACVDPGEFGAHQEDLRRVVDPDEDDDERPRCAVARGDAAFADVQADQELADGEEHGGDERAEQHVVPAHRHARHQLVDHREHDGGEQEADRQVDHLGQHFPVAERAAPPFAERRDDGTEHQRDHEQEGDAEDHAERQQPRAQQVPPAGRALAHRGAPDAVERVLQLAEHRGRADQQQRHAEGRAGDAVRRLVEAGENALDGFGRVGAHQLAELAEDLAARRVLAEHQTGDRDHDQEQRRQREHGVVRERRAHARRVVVDPGLAGAPDELPPFGRRAARRPGDGVGDGHRGRPEARARQGGVMTAIHATDDGLFWELRAREGTGPAAERA